MKTVMQEWDLEDVVCRQAVLRYLTKQNKPLDIRTYEKDVAGATGYRLDDVRAAVTWLRDSGFLNKRFRLSTETGRDRVKRKVRPENLELFP